MSTQALLLQSHVIKAVRQFFDQRQFQEIIVPVMHEALPMEPNIFAFSTTWRTLQGECELYLSISPENYMKKVMAAGIENCYGIGHCFRNLEGAGSHHRPEFLMLEWYRHGETYTAIMNETQELVRFVKHQIDKVAGREPSDKLMFGDAVIDLTGQWPVLSLEKLLLQHAGLNLKDILDDEQLVTAAQAKGYSVEGATWSQLFDQIYLNEVEPHLPNQPCFVIDFPSRLSPLCRPRLDKPYLAERFEVFMGGMELGNGNTENVNAALVEQQFQRETQYRQSQGLQVHPYDTKFLIALRRLEEKQIPIAGIGLGLSRLAMIMANVADISELTIRL